jgi:hypothetical protein
LAEVFPESTVFAAPEFDAVGGIRISEGVVVALLETGGKEFSKFGIAGSLSGVCVRRSARPPEPSGDPPEPGDEVPPEPLPEPPVFVATKLGSTGGICISDDGFVDAFSATSGDDFPKIDGTEPSGFAVPP